jgi:tRNA-(ms[2]io[6]A)-hydroxylase
MAERRRLPVLSNSPPPSPPEPEEEEARPPWHWVFFGTVAIFAAWLPLAYVAGALSARVMKARFGADASRDAIDLALGAMSESERASLMIKVALPGMLALALAAFGGGFVVGRFGSGTRVREAALSGAVTALVAAILAWTGPSLAAVVGAAVTFAVAIGFSAWGGRLGIARRPAG